MDRRENDSQSIIGASLTTAQNRIASVKQTARRQSPLAMALAGCGAVGCERLGARVSRSRLGWVAMFAVPAVLFLVDPAAAQVNCNQGMLKFLTSIKTLTVESVGILLVVMLIAAGALKALSFRGADKWANRAIGGVVIGTMFFVLGPVVVDLADSATPIKLSAGCSTGGN